MIDFELLYFAMLGGFFFGLFVVAMAARKPHYEPVSDYRDILSWGLAVYLTLFGLTSIHRFVMSDPRAFDMLVTGFAIWWSYIFSVLATAGIIRLTWRFFEGWRDDSLQQ